MKKKNQFLKSSVFVLGFAAASFMLILTFISCNNTKAPKHEDSKDLAEEHNDAKFSKSKEDDANFLVNAEEINLEEIQLGQLAQTRGTSSQVKELGKMMETDHTKASSELKALAAKKQVTIPTTLTNDGISANQKLMDIKSTDFDKEYADMMVNGHKDAISKFEKASSDATDADVRSWAATVLPILRTHLDHFITLQNQLTK